MKVNQTTQGEFVMSTLFKKTSKRIAQGLSLVLFTFLSAFQAQADDTEVFFKVNENTVKDAKTNIMFIMDEARSMLGTGQFTFDPTCPAVEYTYKTDANGNFVNAKGYIINDAGYLVNSSGQYIDNNGVISATGVKGEKVVLSSTTVTDLEKIPECYDPSKTYSRPKVLPDNYNTGNTEPEGHKCYDPNMWYFLPNNNLSLVVENPDAACGKGLTNGAPLNRVDRPIDPSINKCDGLEAVMNSTKGGVTGQFLGLYKRNGTGNQRGWYPLDLEYGTWDRRHYLDFLGGLRDTKKLIALECRTDTLATGTVHGKATNDGLYPAENSLIKTLDPWDSKDLATIGWTDQLPSAHTKQWPNSFGGLYKGNYLNFIRYYTKKEKLRRADIFKFAIKRYVEKASSDVRLGLASFKQLKHWGGTGNNKGYDSCLSGEDCVTGNGNGNRGNSDGGNIDVPIRAIDEVHNNFDWFVDNDARGNGVLWGGTNENYGGAYGLASSSYVMAPRGWWDRDIKHREWLWIKADEYISEQLYVSNVKNRLPGIGTTLPANSAGVVEEDIVYRPRLEMGGGAAADYKSASGTTLYRPLGELLFEVARYFKGETVKFGAYSRPETWTEHDKWGTPAAQFDDEWGWKPTGSNKHKILNSSKTYQSPIVDKCQASAAVIFTDYTGENVNSSNAWLDDEVNSYRTKVNDAYPPLNDHDEVDIIEDMIGNNACKSSMDAYGTCLPAVSKYLSETDLNGGIEGKQVVRTFVVSYWDDNAFGGREPNGIKMLRQTAHQGGGKLIRFGSDLHELDRAIGGILNIVGLNPIGSGTFVAPASSVDLSSRLQNDDDIYYSLFEPSDKNRWYGNLKRYKLKFDSDDKLQVFNNCSGVTSASCDEDVVAVNTDNKFEDVAWSAWSKNKDGSEVQEGGAASNMPDADSEHATSGKRKVFTDVGVNPTATSSADLAKLTYTVARSAYSTDIKAAQAFNIQDISTLSSTDLIVKLRDRVKYAQGYDVTDEDIDASFTDTFRRIGDPLHSQPKLVNYKLPVDSSGNPVAQTAKDSVVFFGTNEGYIHAIDTLNGKEIFSFLPQSTFGVLGTYMDSIIAKPDQKPYGMDGEIAVWVNDLNGDGDVINTGTTLDDDEGVYLFAGMRRGGNSYYALDVSDLSKPKLMWRITGDEKVTVTKTGATTTPTKDKDKFYELGQSWAKPVVAKMKIKGKETPVVIIAGGYDGNQDDSGNSIGTDTTGRGIYILKAKTGERVWATGYAADASSNWNVFDKFRTDMTSSFASAPAVFDADGDTYIDTIIATDTGGKVWRIDIDQEENAKTTSSKFVATVDKIANLSGTDATDARRFFVTPDVMLDRSAGANASLMIVLGSGRRPSPLNTEVNDRFYLLRSSPAFGSKKDDSGNYQARDVITESDLLDATEEDAVSTALSGQSTTNSNYTNFTENGFYIRLGTVKTDPASGSNAPRKDAGEKIITAPIIFNGYAVFSSYIPGEVPEKCGDALGDNRFNAVNITNPDVSRYTVQLEQHGIAPRPSVLILSNDGTRRPAIVVGTEAVRDAEKMPAALKSLYTLSRDKLIKFWTEK